MKQSNRAVGGLDLSIATSLALEAFFPDKATDKLNPPPSPPRPITHYTHFYISVRTISRNWINSHETTTAINPVDAATEIVGELTLIQELMRELNPALKLVFILPRYTSIYSNRKLWRTNVRMPATDKALAYRKLQSDILSGIEKLNTQMNIIQMLDTKIPFKNIQRILLLTHMPIDIISLRDASSMDLLESHTGRVKMPVEYYTKFFKSKVADPINIPLNFASLFMMGDAYMFSPTKPAIRKELAGLSVRMKWKYNTSVRKFTIDSHMTKIPELKDLLRIATKLSSKIN